MISCRQYKGNDITNDLQQAITAVRDMARNAYQRSVTNDKNVVRLLQALFGKDGWTHPLASLDFDDMANFPNTADFIVVRHDFMVTLEKWQVGQPCPSMVDGI